MRMYKTIEEYRLSKIMYFFYRIQGNQLNMAMFCWYLGKVTCPQVTVAYTRQVKFYKVYHVNTRPYFTGHPVPENTAMSN